MVQKSNRRVDSYEISNVRKGDGPNEYVVTVMRNGEPVGDVKVRAPSSAPGYFNDVKGRSVSNVKGRLVPEAVG